MENLRLNKLQLLVLLALLFATAFAMAQGIVTGSISGTIEDAQGAVVTNATITAKEVATNRVYTADSSHDGLLALRSLPPGTYDVTVEAPNFRKYENKGVLVNVGAETGLGRIRMEIGSQSETVTVEGTVPLIETNTQQITNTFESQEVKSLPVGNNFDSLTLFAPGVAPAGDAGFSNTNGAGFSVNGQRARNNNFQIDGQNNNDNSIGGPSIFFGNQDAIDQIQVVTQYSAEYGRNSGSVVNYITKRGGNDFHGTGYEFWAGNTFASLDNVEKSSIFGGPVPIPRFVDNRFGGTIGGPIVRDKIWFFGSANFEKQRGASIFSTGTGIVPTANGVSQMATAFPDSPAAALETQIGSTAVSGATYSNLQSVLLSTTADCEASPADLSCVPIEFGQATRHVSQPFNDYEATGRVDFKISNKDNFFARYLFQQTFAGGINFGNGPAIGDWQSIPGRNQQIGLDWVRNVSNTLVNQVRISFSRALSFFNEGGFTGCNSSAPLNCPTDVLMLGGTPQDSVSFGVASGFPQGRIINVYQLQDNASKQIGRHTVKFGGEISQQRSPNLFLPNNNGIYFFNSYTDLVQNNPAQTRLTLGNPHLPFKEWDLAVYFQDDWRIKDNLTLNLGLRWEWNQQAINILHDRSVAQQNGPNPFWDGTLPNTVPSVPQDLNNFSPVVGFAWTPRVMRGLFGEDKTVIRGGFRISYDPAFYNMFLNVATSSPSVIAGQFVAPLPASGFLGSDLNTFLAPDVPTGQPAGRFNHTTVAPNFRNPYSEQWNLGVQHSFTSRIVGEVRYVGNHGVGLFQSVNGNPPLKTLIDNGFSNVIPAGLQPCPDPTKPGGNSQGYANCDFRRVVERGNFAWSKYNSLQNELRIGQWHGVTATASYTWSHTMDNVSEIFSTVGGGNTLSFAQNPFDTNRAERANSGINFANLVGIAFVYDLPFAKGRNDFVGKVAGGWQINTTYRYSPGQPYTAIQFNNFETGAGNLCDPSSTMSGTYSACRPIPANRAAPLATMGQCTDPTLPDCGIVDFFTAAPTTFSAVHWLYHDITADQFYGTPFKAAPRNSLLGQAISSANLSVFKNTKFGERLTLQFQAQAFNVLNRQFRGSPDPLVDDIAQGTFGNNFSNADAGASSTANSVYDGIGRRRLLFGAKLIF
jgi:Carboxypeptidase regulatory-like domain/TonB-dependent Receptor Plug Domain/TonB dependent receptor